MALLYKTMGDFNSPIYCATSVLPQTPQLRRQQLHKKAKKYDKSRSIYCLQLYRPPLSLIHRTPVHANAVMQLDPEAQSPLLLTGIK